VWSTGCKNGGVVIRFAQASLDRRTSCVLMLCSIDILEPALENLNGATAVRIPWHRIAPLSWCRTGWTVIASSSMPEGMQRDMFSSKLTFLTKSFGRHLLHDCEELSLVEER
jgi:hypothetical protein